MHEGKFFCEISFCLIYFYSCKKSGGGGGGAKAPPAPPSARSLNNTLAASFWIEKKPKVSSVFLLIYNLLPNILDEHLTVRKNSCPFNLFLSRERMTFARLRETFCSCARYLSLECTWLSARVRMTVWSYTHDCLIVYAWLFARACLSFCSRARYFPLVLQLIYSHYELN